MSEIAVNKALPSYLNELYMKNALEKAKKCQLKVEKSIIECITKTGENFCSDIYRVCVVYRDGGPSAPQLEESFIVKVLHPSMIDIGTSELIMFEQVLPAMERILQESTVPVNAKLNARCLITDAVDKELYVLENLNALGYQSADRCLGLDEQHARLSLEKLACFHAASMVYAKEHPDMLAKLAPSHFANGPVDPIGKVIALDGMDYVIKLVSSWSGYVEIVEKMRRQVPYYSERLSKAVSHQQSAYNVIVHGDLWVNNILFSYEEHGTKPKDAVFVDFQNCYLGSPAIDINFFLSTSLQLTVLQTKRYELVRHYYQTFVATLLTCGYAKSMVPTWQMFNDELRRCEFYGYYSVICELPICCMNKQTSEGFTAQTFEDPVVMREKRTLMYDNERVKSTIAYSLDRLNELGVFDDLV